MPSVRGEAPSLQTCAQDLSTMENFEQVGQMFVNHFFTLFDSNIDGLAGLYTPQSCLSFEGTMCQGREAIMAKLKSLPFKKVQHVVTKTDIQPTIDSGLMVLVIGQLKTDDDPPHGFSQSFYLKQDPSTGAFVLLNDMFRLSLHNG